MRSVEGFQHLLSPSQRHTHCRPHPDEKSTCVRVVAFPFLGSFQSFDTMLIGPRFENRSDSAEWELNQMHHFWSIWGYTTLVEIKEHNSEPFSVFQFIWLFYDSLALRWISGQIDMVSPGSRCSKQSKPRNRLTPLQSSDSLLLPQDNTI